MKDEHIIVNKTLLLQIMEDNNKPKYHFDGYYVSDAQSAKVDLIEELLEKSTLLIPELEKAFDEGKSVGIMSYQPQGHTLDVELYNERKQNYISNLKLEI